MLTGTVSPFTVALRCRLRWDSCDKWSCPVFLFGVKVAALAPSGGAARCGAAPAVTSVPGHKAVSDGALDGGNRPTDWPRASLVELRRAAASSSKKRCSPRYSPGCFASYLRPSSWFGVARDAAP